MAGFPSTCYLSKLRQVGQILLSSFISTELKIVNISHLRGLKFLLNA